MSVVEGSAGGWGEALPQSGDCNKTFTMAATTTDCFTIYLDNEDDITRVKLMKTMMCEVAVTHRNMLTDYLGSLPQQW